MPQLEAKYMNAELEVKFSGNQGRFTGYGSVFGNVDSYRDVVEKGAFRSTIEQNQTIPILWQHNSYEPIGVFEQMREDEKGLYVEGQLNMDTNRGREAFSLLKQGAIRGLSIGYYPVDTEMDSARGVRLIKEIDLMEISLVTFPANVEAQVFGLKNCQDMTISEFERLLREAGGFSKSAATMIAAKGFKAFQERREAADGDADKKAQELIDAFKSALEGLSKN